MAGNGEREPHTVASVGQEIKSMASLTRMAGARFRRMRDKYAMTEARKAANRMGFGELEEDEFQDEALAQKIIKQKGRVRAAV